MAKLLPALLVCLVTLHGAHGNRTRIQAHQPSAVGPKSFRGTLHQSNHTNRTLVQLHANTRTSLSVGPQDAAAAYASGVLSTWVIPSAYVLAMVVGVPANAYILAFLRVRLRERCLSSLALYLSLASSDLLLLLSLGLRVHYHVSGNDWAFGEAACRVLTALFYGNVYGSAHTVACISLRRYLAVVRPFLYRRLHKAALAAWTCLSVWVVFGAAAVPELLVRQSFQVAQLGVTTCHDVLPLEESPHALLVPYRLTLICLGFVAPFLVCVGTHWAVVRHLGRSDCDWRPFVRASTLVFFIFVVCFSPSGVLHVAHHVHLISGAGDGLYGYYRAAVCLCCFHSCLDPFLCMLVSNAASSELRFISRSRTPPRPDAEM